MYLILLISVVAQLTVITFGSTPPFNITLGDNSQSLELPKWNISEYNTLWLNAYGIRQNIKNGDCDVRCTVAQKMQNVSLKCHIVGDKQLYLNVGNTNITRNYAGKWSCKFNVNNTTPNNLQPSQNLQIETLIYDFYLDVLEFAVQLPPEPKYSKLWIYVGVPVLIIILLLIGAQTMCIVHYKSKASQRDSIKQLSTKRNDSNEDPARYCQMPVRRKISIPQEERESIIYEDPETLLALPLNALKPVPPPLSTLPRTPKPSHQSQQHTGAPKSPVKHQAISMAKKKQKTSSGKFSTNPRPLFNNNPSDFINTLQLPSTKSPSIPSVSQTLKPRMMSPQQMQTLRPQLKQEMTPPQTPERSAKFRKNPIPTPPPKTKLISQQLLKKTPPISSISQTLKPPTMSPQQMQMLPSQLKQAKQLQKTVPNLPVPNRPVPNLPVPNRPVPNLPVPNLPVPNLPVPNLPVPNLPVPNLSVPNLPVPNLSVPNLPVPKLSVPNLPAPTLYPKPPRYAALEPESNPETTAESTSDDEEWTYEPLGEFHIYNM